MTGPSDDELREASLGLQIVAATGISILQLQAAAAAQTYQVQASAIGVSPEQAARVLDEVTTELRQTGASGDRYDIARNRLATGEDFRPPEQLREAARQMLVASGYSLHPEHVDAHAWQLQRVVDAYTPRAPWYMRWWRRVRNALRRKKRT